MIDQIQLDIRWDAVVASIIIVVCLAQAYTIFGITTENFESRKNKNKKIRAKTTPLLFCSTSQIYMSEV